MEELQATYLPIVTELLGESQLIEPLLIAGAGVFLFLLSEQSARAVNIFNAIFVALGLFIGVLLTAFGLFAVYETMTAIGAENIAPAAAPAAEPAPAPAPADNG